MPTPIILPAKATSALDPDVVAAWAGTDRPTIDALLAAGLPIPLEDAPDAQTAAALIKRYERTGLKAQAVHPPKVPSEWIKATAILAITAVVFRVMSGDTSALMDISALPAMAAIYTTAIVGVTWVWRKSRSGAMDRELVTARSHLTTAAPMGPSTTLITRIRHLRREVVAAGLTEVIQGEMLRSLFELEVALNTTGTLPVEAAEAVEVLAGRLKAAVEGDAGKATSEAAAQVRASAEALRS